MKPVNPCFRFRELLLYCKRAFSLKILKHKLVQTIFSASDQIEIEFSNKIPETKRKVFYSSPTTVFIVLNEVILFLYARI